MTTTSTGKSKRVPASERRDALIEAAVHEFAQGGLHGTPVDRIARAVGVAQPYVFSLFGSKRELFLAAVDRCYERVRGLLSRAATDYASQAHDEVPIGKWMGDAYVDMLATDRDALMLQLQSYAACDDEVIRQRVRANFTGLARFVRDLMGPETPQEEIEEFFRYGMLINVSAAMGVETMAGGGWLADELAGGA